MSKKTLLGLRLAGNDPANDDTLGFLFFASFYVFDFSLTDLIPFDSRHVRSNNSIRLIDFPGIDKRMLCIIMD